MHIPLYLIGAYAERRALYERFVVERLLPSPYEIVATWLQEPREDVELSDAERRYISNRNEHEIMQSFGCIYVPSTVPGFGRDREIGMALALRRPVLMLRDRTVHPLDHHPLLYPCTELTLIETLRKVVPYERAF